MRLLLCRFTSSQSYRVQNTDCFAVNFRLDRYLVGQKIMTIQSVIDPGRIQGYSMEYMVNDKELVV